MVIKIKPTRSGGIGVHPGEKKLIKKIGGFTVLDLHVLTVGHRAGYKLGKLFFLDIESITDPVGLNQDQARHHNGHHNGQYPK